MGNPYHVRLAISQYGNDYRAELFTEDLGDTNGELISKPKWETLDDNFRRYLSKGAIGLAPETITKAGQELFDLLIGSGENSKKWAEILQRAEQQQRSIRLLIDATTDDVRDLPYGLLCDPDDDYYLFRPGQNRPAIQFVRIIRRCTPRPLRLTATLQDTNRRLRLLLATAEPKDLPFAGTTQLCQLAKALERSNRFELWICGNDGMHLLSKRVAGSPGDWQPTQFEPFIHTTPKILENALQQPDIDVLHLLAHGTGGGLILCDEHAGRVDITNKELGEWCGKSELDLAFLQICKGSQSGERGSFGGVAQQLLNPKYGNLPAVVASPYPLEAADSTGAAIAFYEALSKGHEPDAALDRGGQETALIWAFLELWVRPSALGGTSNRGAFQFVSPYKGLARFEERDAEIFFGRDAETAELINLLAAESIVAVVGDSGSGKSSLLQAGLAHQVRQHGLLNQHGWHIVSLTPSEHPLQSLQTALGANTKTKEALLDCIEHALPTLLIFDQFEELFTLCTRIEEQQIVTDILAEAASRFPDKFRLVLGMRSEYLSTLSGVQRALVKRPWVLNVPGEEQVKQLVQEPASQYGYTFEGEHDNGTPSLLEKIFQDELLRKTTVSAENEVTDEAKTNVIGLPAILSLPLLEFALERLWLKAVERGSREFTCKDYEDLKGLSGAIAAHADDVYDNRLPIQFSGVADSKIVQQVTKAVFSGMVSSQGTRRRRMRTELEQEAGQPELAGKIIDFLVGERLLTLSSASDRSVEAQVTIAHEVLINRWNKLQQWLENDETHAIQAAFQEAAEKFIQHSGKSRFSSKLPPWLIGQALPSLKDRRDYLAWVDKSEPKLTRKQNQFVSVIRKNWLFLKIQLSFVVIFLISAAVLAYWSQIEAEKATREARRQLAQNYFANGIFARDERGDWLKAVHSFMRAATEFAKANDITSSLNAQLAGNHLLERLHLNFVLQRDPHRWDLSAQFSPDDQKVSTWSDDGIVRVWNSLNGELFTSIKAYAVDEDDDNPHYLKTIFSHDSSKILIWTEKEEARVWDSSTGQPLTPLLRTGKQVRGATFSEDGTRVVTWYDDNTALVWDSKTDTKNPLTSFLQHSLYEIPIFNRDSNQLLTWSKNGAQIWDISRNMPLTPLMRNGEGVEIQDVQLSNDGNKLLTLGGDGSVQLWSSSTGKPLLSNPLGKKFKGALFNPDSNRVLTWNENSVQILDSFSGNAWKMDGKGIHGAVFSVDGRKVLAWTDDVILIADSNNGDIMYQLQDKFSSETPVFSSDGNLVLNFYDDGIARIWKSHINNKKTFDIGIVEVEKKPIFSSDSNRLLSLHEDGVARLWDSTTGSPLTISMKHSIDIGGASFSKKGDRVLTWGQEGTARIWETDQHAPFFLLENIPSTNIDKLLFSKNGNRILIRSDDDSVKVWNSFTGKELLSSDKLIHKNNDSGPLLTNDGSKVMTWDENGTTVQIWDFISGKKLVPPLGSKLNSSNLIFSDDGSKVLTWDNNEAQVWDSNTGKEAILTLSHEGIKGAFFYQGSDQILTWGDPHDDQEDILIKTWDIKTTPRELSSWSIKKYSNSENKDGYFPYEMSLSNDGHHLLYIVTFDSFRDFVQVWNVTTGKELTEPLKHEDCFPSAGVFNSDGNRLLTWSHNSGATGVGGGLLGPRQCSAHIWDIKGDRKLTFLHSSTINGAAFSTDNRKVLTWSVDGSARVWDSHSGEPLTPPLLHKPDVQGAVFSNDGQKVLTWSGDSVRVWATSQNGESLTPWLKHESKVLGARFSHDGRQVLSWSKGSVRRWPIDLDTDWPREELILVAEVHTGVRMNQFGELDVLSADEWQQKKCQYETILQDKKSWPIWKDRCKEIQKQKDGIGTSH